jgi:hypothetical protein
MDIPWADNVRQKGELAIFRDGKIGGTWGTVFNQSIAAFNRLSGHLKLGVVLKESKHAPVDGGGGADVGVSTANGVIALTYEGTAYPDTLTGTGLHGLTRTVTRQTAITVVEKAFIFLPQQPKTLPPTGGWQPVGTNVMEVILVHEFIHACGLEKHTPGDVFQDVPSIEGNIVKAGNVRMPPIFISGSTASRIQALWA